MVAAIGWRLHRRHRGPQFLIDTTNTGGYFYLAKSGYLYLATSGYFFMATDTVVQAIRKLPPNVREWKPKAKVWVIKDAHARLLAKQLVEMGHELSTLQSLRGVPLHVTPAEDS
ncbi:hypothetical protein BST16_09165 [Mycobacterium asiaticum DSM 44297]|nr:hypothetical protein BST16_09165 [Mycobacterium asiaticum DSM 44297]